MSRRVAAVVIAAIRLSWGHGTAYDVIEAAQKLRLSDATGLGIVVRLGKK